MSEKQMTMDVFRKLPLSLSLSTSSSSHLSSPKRKYNYFKKFIQWIVLPTILLKANIGEFFNICESNFKDINFELSFFSSLFFCSFFVLNFSNII